MDELKELDMVAEECHFCEANLIRRDEVSSELVRVILLEEKVRDKNRVLIGSRRETRIHFIEWSARLVVTM